MFESTSARFSSSTGGTGTISAAQLELDLDSTNIDHAELPLSNTILAPDQPISTCADVSLSGSAPAQARLYATIVDGTGLEDYTIARVVVQRGSCLGLGFITSVEDLDPDDGTLVYDGPLSALLDVAATDGSGTGAGVVLANQLLPTEQLAVSVSLWLPEDPPNAAQGLWFDVDLWVEATA